MVIQVIQQFNVLPDPMKGQSPIRLNRDGMKSETVSAERMQAPRWATKILWATCNPQSCQKLTKSGRMDGLNAPRAACEIKPLKSFVPKRENHNS